MNKYEKRWRLFGDMAEKSSFSSKFQGFWGMTDCP